ncbi:MAG: hypothetical protein A2Z04_08655 [Chloroflexi bacterium RBG_16_57_9]|nr:MAG: hypothetical protein A2Z04_08655 [Chloroflexi bacterium RBG_16_57_9]
MDKRRLVYPRSWMLVCLTCLVLLAIGVIGLEKPLAAEGEPLPAFEPGQVMVKLRPEGRAQADEVAARHGATVIEDLTSGWYLLAVPNGQEQAAIVDLLRDELVSAAELNYRIISFMGLGLRSSHLESFPTFRLQPDQLTGGAQLASAANDPQFPAQWNLIRIRVASQYLDEPSAWDYTTGGSNIIIAILGTGIDRNHPDLKDKLLPGYDFVNKDDDPSEDGMGFGTMQAGIAAAISNNHLGVAGASWGARILPVKVLDSKTGGNYATVIKGINYAVDQKANIINMSFSGYDSNYQALQEAINYAVSRGALPIASVGEKGAEPELRTPYPAALNGVLGVTATDRNDVRLPSSGHGPFVDVAAPGEDIIGTYCENDYRGYATGYGSEFAAPQVSGVAALIWSMNPTLKATEVARIIKESARDLGPSGPGEDYDYGLVDAMAGVMKTPHYLEVNRPFLHFGQAGNMIQPSQYTITNTYTSAPTWVVTTTADWLMASQPTVNVPSTVTISITPGAEHGCDSRSAQAHVTSLMEQTVTKTITLNAILRYNRPCPVRVYVPWIGYNQRNKNR